MRCQLTTLDAAYFETDANPIRSCQSNPYDSEDEVGTIKLISRSTAPDPFELRTHR